MRAIRALGIVVVVEGLCVGAFASCGGGSETTSTAGTAATLGAGGAGTGSGTMSNGMLSSGRGLLDLS